MNCAVIRDLLPLYMDNCCSAETKELVEHHLAGCSGCAAEYEEMKKIIVGDLPQLNKKDGLQKVYARRASVLQAALFMFSFLLITFGVAREAGTGSNSLLNGIWAFLLVVPATGFFLSLINYFFVREYKNAKRFRVASVLLTLFIAAVAFLWTWQHYAGDLWSLTEIFQWKKILLLISYTAILGFLSYFCAKYYARWLGKE